MLLLDVVGLAIVAGLAVLAALDAFQLLAGLAIVRQLLAGDVEPVVAVEAELDAVAVEAVASSRPAVEEALEGGGAPPAPRRGQLAAVERWPAPRR